VGRLALVYNTSHKGKVGIRLIKVPEKAMVVPVVFLSHKKPQEKESAAMSSSGHK